jgi:hypothetical protein
MNQREYWCFISYQHLDNREEGRQWATWLHQALETYEVPEDLISTRNERGEIIPERLFPVFRDEEELATGELTQRIHEALDRTRTLIVLCSPRATRSVYVDKEIRYFKQLKKPTTDRRIHACIIDGDPNGTADSGENCFPEALRHEVEVDEILKDHADSPLGADLRLANGEQGWTTPEAYRRALTDGTNPQRREEIERQVAAYSQKLKISLLRLISGILGVPFGTLQARDKAYQLKIAQARARTLRRWLTAVSVLAVLVISTSVFSYIQSQQIRRGDRVASARQTLELARVLNDEDPLAALKQALNGLSVLEKDDPGHLEDAYNGVAEVVRSGRWARIGKNVRSMLPTADGKNLLVVNSDDVGELILTADLTSGWAQPGVRAVSPPWGPNSIWVTLDAGTTLDIRDGSFGLQRIRDVTEIRQPAQASHWQFIAKYDDPRAACSLAFAECFITSFDNDPEGGAGDSYVERVDFSSGEVSQVGDLYEVAESRRTETPCLVTREDERIGARIRGGWHLTTAKGKTYLGDKYDFDLGSFSFSPEGLYVLVRKKDASITVFSCRTGDPLFTRKHGKEPVRAAFSAGDTFLMLLVGSRAQIISAPEFKVMAAFTHGFTGVSSVQELPGLPASWTLSSDRGQEIVTYRNQKLWRGLGSIEPSGHLAALKASTGAFLDLSRGMQVSIPAMGHAFGSKPGMSLFATFHKLPERKSGRPDQIDRVTLRDVRSPEKSLHEIDRPDPGIGEGEIQFGQFGEFFYVTTYEREVSSNPPFDTRYTHQTEFFDSLGGGLIGTIQFQVKSCTSSRDRAGALTLCQGSTNKRDDLRVVLGSTTRSVIWVADSDSDKIEAIFSGDTENPRYFVVAFDAAPGAVHRTSDGKKVVDLSGPIVRAELLPDGDHLVAWYKNGRSELWELREDGAVLLAALGLIVADVRLIPGTRQLVVRHDDGRTYLIDIDWLSTIRTQTVREIVENIRDRAAGPASSRWWQPGHPDHYPWKKLPPAEPTP